MYLEHFGFRVLPFENVPDPAFFFNEGEYQRILRRITSAVGAGRGLMVVAGPIGSGKTTLSQKIRFIPSMLPAPVKSCGFLDLPETRVYKRSGSSYPPDRRCAMTPFRVLLPGASKIGPHLH